jgi:hypothetical protein
MSAVFTFLASLLASAALSLAPAAHMTQDDPAGWPPIQCGRPCVIEEDHGGVIDLYSAQAEEMAGGHVPLIVDGPCFSACTIFVDIDRANACVTTNAVFGYHQSETDKTGGKSVFGQISYQTPGLNAYIKAHGGLPTPDTGRMLMINFSQLTQFYQPCAGAA